MKVVDCVKCVAIEIGKSVEWRKLLYEEMLDLHRKSILFSNSCFRFQRGLKRKPMALIKRLRKSKKSAPEGEKPETVRTHLRNMIIVPEMIGSVCGVYNGKSFTTVEIKVSSISIYLWISFILLTAIHWWKITAYYWKHSASILPSVLRFHLFSF